MAIQIIEQALPYGRLAENFGRNLGESLESETSRQMTVRGVTKLSDQLTQIQNEGGKLPNRLQLISALDKVQGMDPDTRDRYLPALESSLRDNEAQLLLDKENEREKAVESAKTGAGDTGGVTADYTADAAPVPARTVSTPATPITTLVTPEGQASLVEKPVYRTDQEIAVAGAALRRENPGLYPTIESGEAAARVNENVSNKNLAARQAKATAAGAATQSVKDKTTNRILNKLQTDSLEGTYSQLPGTIQDTFLNRAVEKVFNGATEDQAAEEVSREALAAVKKINQFRSKETDRGIFGGRGQEALKVLEPYRKLYEDLNALDEYEAELIKKGFGPHMASTSAHPASVAVKKVLGKVSNAANPSPEKKESLGYSFAKKLANSMSPLDSVQTVALAFNDAGYDEEMFYNAMDERVEEGFELTPFQRRELDRRLPVSPEIADIWTSFQGSTGQQPKGKYGFLETIMRVAGGVR